MLSISAQCSIFTQFEKCHTIILGVLAKQHVMRNSHSEKASIIELNKKEKGTRTPKSYKEALFIVPVGKKEKDIAAVEAEFWLCCNI